MISQRQLKRLHRAGQRFLAPLSPFDTYVALVEEGRKLSRAEWGSVFIPEGDGFKKVYASLPSLLPVRPRRKGTVYKAFSSRKSVIYTEKQLKALPINHPEFRGLSIRSAVMVPICYGTESMGVLCLHSTQKNHFTKESVQMLELFGSMAVICIRKTQLYEQVQKALEQRDLFISIASHELKTPLTAAILYSDLLKNKLQEKAVPEVKLSESLSSEIARLKRLINELLQVERIKEGSLQYEWRKCSMQEVIKQAVIHFKTLYPFHTVYVKQHTHDSRDSVFGDFDKLLQVVTNLLINAAKYSLPTQKITVVLEEQNSLIKVCIADNGRGIPEKDLTNIFDKYYKGQNSLHEGMGLGLYLTKHIIDTHGGHVSVESALNKGTTVVIELPKL